MTSETDNENWAACETPAVGDTVRWREPVWAAPNKPRGKPDQIGEQRITAGITGWSDVLELQVQAVERLSGAEEAQLKVKAGDQIKRKISTLDRGACQRLQKN